jgi:CubicO group peptidase (beta-lactamase class C family)
MARWNGFLLTGRPAIVSKDSLAQLLRPRVAVPDSPLKEQYGYGIQSARVTGDTLVYHHAGGVDGFTTFSEIHPATGLSIVVFSNIQTADAAQITENLAALARA